MSWFRLTQYLEISQALIPPLQSNMIGYSRKWNKVIAGMFGNSVGTSMDFPNLYRKAHGHSTEEYTALWTRNVRLAREAGINIGVISIPNKETLRLGGAAFYSYFHGGWPVRAYSITGQFFVKDPYCEVYKALFSRMESLAADLSRAQFKRSLPVLQAKEEKWQQKQSWQRQLEL